LKVSTEVKRAAIATAIALAAALQALQAQSPTDEVSRLEQQGKRVYSRTYRGITATGQYETADEAKARTDGTRRQEVRVEVHGNTAIVTGVETADGAADRVLRIWMKDGDRWQIVAGQTTWIGSRTDVPDPSGPLPPTTPAPFQPASAAEVAIWRSQEALMRSFAEADPDSYRRFSTAPSLRMMTNGDAIPREQWIDTIAKRSKGPLAVVDEIRIAVYGDVGLVTLRGHEANPTRQSWVYLLEGGTWKLHLRFTTAIRN
jgi:ketosteroid isomerase-like protein